MLKKKFTLSVCGGTFDLFHKGHESFLDYCFKNSNKVTVGITSDKFSHSKQTFQNFSVRKNNVETFLKKNKYNGEIIEIDDLYGPTLSKNTPYEAIFVTKDSVGGAKKINKRRKELGLKDLKIVLINLKGGIDGRVISSTRIKKGEVDRNGNLFLDNTILASDFLLPRDLREDLSKPFGVVIRDFDAYIRNGNLSNKFTISIGDVTTKTLLSHNIAPQISVIDLIVGRKKKFNRVYDLGFKNEKIIKVENPAGTITSNLINKTFRSFKIADNEKVVLNVVGEEDLAVMPMVLASPLGYEIYYGQPGVGVVKIVVTVGIKEQVKSLISKFKRKVL